VQAAAAGSTRRAPAALKAVSREGTGSGCNTVATAVLTAAVVAGSLLPMPALAADLALGKQVFDGERQLLRSCSSQLTHWSGSRVSLCSAAVGHCLQQATALRATPAVSCLFSHVQAALSSVSPGSPVAQLGGTASAAPMAATSNSRHPVHTGGNSVIPDHTLQKAAIEQFLTGGLTLEAITYQVCDSLGPSLSGLAAVDSGVSAPDANWRCSVGCGTGRHWLTQVCVPVAACLSHRWKTERARCRVSTPCVRVH
jgi:hypothetical protein